MAVPKLDKKIVKKHRWLTLRQLYLNLFQCYKNRIKRIQMTSLHMDTPLHGMDLPNEIIEKIFLGCHVKLLTTFKCLSKDWNAIISEDSFRKRYWSQQQSDGNSPTGFICGRIHNLYESKGGYCIANKFLCTSKNYVKKKELDSFAYTNMFCRRIIAASKGLLLLSDNLKTLCVYDLVSKKHITLPQSNLETGYRLSLGFKCEERGSDHHPDLCYKVVLVDTRGACDIYSSETGIWQKTILKIGFPYRFRMKSNLIAKVIRGVFHWYSPFVDAIVAYDSEDPKGRAVFIELPSMGNYFRESMTLFEGTKDGSLQFIWIDGNNHIKVWIITSTSGQNYMDDDMVPVNKWILTSSVSLFDIGVSFGDIDFLMEIYACAISVDPVDPHIVYLEVARKLYAYDYRQGKVVFTFSGGLPAGANVFVPFEWPTWPCL